MPIVAVRELVVGVLPLSVRRIALGRGAPLRRAAHTVSGFVPKLPVLIWISLHQACVPPRFAAAKLALLL